MNRIKIATIALMISAHCATQSVETRTTAILIPATTGLVEGGIAAAMGKRLYDRIPTSVNMDLIDKTAKSLTESVSFKKIPTIETFKKTADIWNTIKNNKLDTFAIVTLGALAIQNFIQAYQTYTQPTASTPE